MLESEDRFTPDGVSLNQYLTQYRYDANGNRAQLQYPDGNIVNYVYDFADRPYSAQQGTALNAAALHRAQDSLRAQIQVRRSFQTTASPLTSGAEKHVGSVRLRPRPAWEQSRGRLSSYTSTGAFNASAPVLRNGTLIGSRRPLEPGTGMRAQIGIEARRRSTLALTGAASSAYVASATYLPFGPLTAITYGNGTVQNLTYNQRYLPTANSLMAGSAALSSYTYGEDGDGNITQITDNLNAGYDRTYDYDELQRLITANTGANLWGTGSYTYDGLGDILNVTLGYTTRSFTYYPGNGDGGNPNSTIPLVLDLTQNNTITPFAYDLAGNMYGGGTENLTYSARNLMASDSTASTGAPNVVSSYSYDGYGRRIQTILPSGTVRDSLFDPEEHLISETPQFSPGSLPTTGYYDYVWFGDRPVAQMDSTGTHWTYGDYLGTPLIQTDINANVTWQADYEPYGSVYALRAGSTVHQPLRFPGQSAEQFDTGANGISELSYNNARWYQPSWGRYTQPDPVGLGGANLYAYVAGNPTNWDDPLGLCLVQVFYHQIENTKGLFNFASHGNLRVTENSSGTPDYYGNGQGDEGSTMYDAEPTGAGGTGNLHVNVVPWFGAQFPARGARGAIYRTPAGRRGPVTVIDDGLPCTCEKKALQSAVNKINGSNIPYFADPDAADQDVFGNSNGALYELLNSLGKAGNAPPGGAIAPGYGPLNYSHTVNPIGIDIDGSF